MVVFGDSVALRRLNVRCLVALYELAHRTQEANDAGPLDEPTRRLVDALLERGANVRTRAALGGRLFELVVDAPDGSVIVECDRGDATDQCAARRRIVLRQDEQARKLVGALARVPAWRCVVEPEQVADELLRPRATPIDSTGRRCA